MSRSASQFPSLRRLGTSRRVALPVPPATDARALAAIVGRRLQRGQALLDHPGETSHVARSPVHGTIVEITRVPIVGAPAMPAAVVETDPASRDAGPDEADAQPSDTPRSADAGTVDAPSTDSESIDAAAPDATPADLPRWIDRIRSAGIWAMRCTSPDLVGQLQQLLRRPCDTVICHTLDSDADSRLSALLASQHGDEILLALRLLGQVTGAARLILAVASASAAPLSMSRARRSGVRIASVRNVYPQADPTLLIHALLKRKLRSGRLPTEQGVLLLDAAAAVAIGRLIRHDEPMLEVPLVVHDAPGRRTHHLLVPVGTRLGEVLDGLAMQHVDVPLRCGDALRSLATRQDAVIAGGELAVHVGYAPPPANPEPCIRCGWCVQACPTHIHPAALLEAVQSHDPSRAESYGIGACIECGICSYVCPSRLPLLGAIRAFRTRPDRLAPRDTAPEPAGESR